MIEEEGISRKEAIRRSNLRDAQKMEKHGWIIHALSDAPGGHTHGLREVFGHPDLEVMLPVDPQTIGVWLHAIVNAIKDGEVFADGEEVEGIFSCPVRFCDAIESGRSVLRVLFPDPQGRFPGELGCQPVFDEQMEGIAG